MCLLLTVAGCGSSDGGADAGACLPCVTDADCGGGVCAQLGGDSYCAGACAGSSGCTNGALCTPVVDVAGKQVDVCIAPDSPCSAAPSDFGAPDSSCGTLVDPTTPSSCTSCTKPSGCQANGCYGGWWCNTASSRCQPPPSSCGSTTGSPYDGGAAVDGTIGTAGGSVSRLLFAVVGDTRPPVIDDTAGYPTPIITSIFSGIEELSPRPSFVAATGDYMFASTGGGQSSVQLDTYLGARAAFAGPLFPALGNHECTGATASNCGTGAVDGVTANYTAFTSKMLGPIGQSDPYYSIPIQALDGSWTAKLVFIAANAWSSAQGTWLESTLAQPTTYTFVFRHEPRAASTAPGVSPSEAILGRYPYTMAFVGHTHTYKRTSQREVIIGNGGAPITGSGNYGFAIVAQRPDGAIQIDMLDYATHAYDTGFRFAVKADGSAAP